MLGARSGRVGVMWVCTVQSGTIAHRQHVTVNEHRSTNAAVASSASSTYMMRQKFEVSARMY